MPKADMLAMECCIFEMVNYHKAFDYELESGDRQKLIKKIKAKEYKLHSKIEERISDRCKDIISKLLQPNPFIRLTATQTINTFVAVAYKFDTLVNILVDVIFSSTISS